MRIDRKNKKGNTRFTKQILKNVTPPLPPSPEYFSTSISDRSSRDFRVIRPRQLLINRSSALAQLTLAKFFPVRLLVQHVPLRRTLGYPSGVGIQAGPD